MTSWRLSGEESGRNAAKQILHILAGFPQSIYNDEDYTPLAS
jgi:hypothetical protein